MPLVRHFPISQLKRLAVRRLHPKTLLARAAPTGEDLCDLKPPTLPAQRERAIGIIGIGTAFNAIHSMAFCYHYSSGFNGKSIGGRIAGLPG